MKCDLLLASTLCRFTNSSLKTIRKLQLRDITCSMLYTLCFILYALCFMFYIICFMLYIRHSFNP
ncbi:hypothetical protein IC582_013164 [Cucumis melo]